MSKPAGVLFLECPCGLNRGIPVEDFDSDDAITQCPDKHVVIECPDCGDTRKTKEFSRIYKPDQSTDDCPWYRMVLDEKKAPTGGKNPFDALRDRAGDTDDETDSRTCSGCSRELGEGQKRYGPDGPGDAWVFFACPDCNERTPAE